MPNITPRIARLATTSNSIRLGPASVSTALHRFGSGWTGRQPEEHITETQDGLNVHSEASKSGKQERASSSEQSSATNEKDHGNQNKKAKEENPESPGPVLGMNDERGGVSFLG
ncbi:hypothetical protein MMC31_003411 [Peltigera leucophlebia]|nr:hypothetical protein [Peltigera leucophlebia]